MLAELFCWKEDEWQADLRGLGFYLGKFVYLMDAYEDMEKDNKKGNYNPFLLTRGQIKNKDLAESLGGNVSSNVRPAFDYSAMGRFSTNPGFSEMMAREKEQVNLDESEGEKEKEQKKQQQEEDEKAQQEQEEKENALKAEIANNAVAQERQRLQEIEKISNSIDADLVQEAKFGATACDAKELAFRSMQREAQKANKALEKMQKDADASKVNTVISTPAAPDATTTKEQEQNMVNEVQAALVRIQKAKGGVQ